MLGSCDMQRKDIEYLCDNEILSPLDIQFAKFLLMLSGRESPELFLAAALASKLTGEGHICLDLSFFEGKPLHKIENENESVICPKLPAWRRILETSPVVGMPGEYKPLILDKKSRLYLFRYWDYEKRLAERIKIQVGKKTEKVDISLLIDGLNRLFPVDRTNEPNWQKIAVTTAMLKKFCVISGGPGTGKTTTVVKILVLLLEQAKTNKLRIALAAPTGKAASRLQEAVKNAKGELDCSEKTKEAIPEEAFTIHRLLGGVPDSPYFHYNRENQLPLDVVVVDEVSMVSLSLMSKLIEAIPLESRVIILGDKDQLASVEAGAVLGDICDTGKIHSFSRQYLQILKQITGDEIKIPPGRKNESGIQDCIVHLQKSFRFGSESGIGEVSLAVNKGDGNRALILLKTRKHQGVKWLALPPQKSLYSRAKEPIVRGFERFLKARNPEEALRLLERFRVLCVVREGPYGVSALNFLIEEVLKHENLIEPDKNWYPGRPVLITRNDYSLKLFNGDVGVILPDPKMPEEIRAFFPGADGNLRKFPTIRLPEHETVYAMTVHKSQGSEFDEVLFVLPDRPSPILTRELIYTGITRAKRSIEVWGLESIFRTAVSRRIERTSGLRDALWED